ncbi:hypothetical protein E2K80_06960 [Rhodophyticola sp. CCM32]|uniref:hypothetical protein n=1 Tax=Rhodophyticola sp. CCM32 TaxID=2916397 RepID=UPI00107F545F|nr:hypothetical protein [Rhodophyticola sp. CCM32]QBY00508.1 hypothetical protein E2K80_06960 [Rhodophyticola sp. CCM32]
MEQSTGVPYYSQWQNPDLTESIIAGADPCDDPLWPQSGFENAADYRYWSVRLCGIACLRSILGSRNASVPTQYELLVDALAWGVYKKREDGTVLGMIYQPFCEWVRARFGLQALFFEHQPLTDALEIRDTNHFLIMSVSPDIREPQLSNPPKGGHLVLVTSHGKEELRFHNPSGIPPEHSDVRLRQNTFEKFYAGRGILIKDD